MMKLYAMTAGMMRIAAITVVLLDTVIIAAIVMIAMSHTANTVFTIVMTTPAVTVTAYTIIHMCLMN